MRLDTHKDGLIIEGAAELVWLVSRIVCLRLLKDA